MSNTLQLEQGYEEESISYFKNTKSRDHTLKTSGYKLINKMKLLFLLIIIQSAHGQKLQYAELTTIDTPDSSGCSITVGNVTGKL